MTMPTTKTLLWIVLGLLIMGECLIAPNASRKPVTTPDGATVYLAEGRVKTQLDIAGYMKSNWEGFTLVLLSSTILLVAICRVIWFLLLVNYHFIQLRIHKLTRHRAVETNRSQSEG